MRGIVHVDDAVVEATTGHMLVTFTSGGEAFQFHLPSHVALKFRQMVMHDAWKVCCAPAAEVVKLKPTRRTKDKGKSK